MKSEIFSVVTVIGPDRLGIAEDIARLVTSQGGNIAESKMAVLGGDFAAIVLVSMPAANLDAFTAALASQEQKLNLHFHLKGTTQPRPAASGTLHLLETISLDSPGIVQAVTGILNKHGINIEELETETQPAPWSGTPTFHMRAKVMLGNETAVSLLKDDLSRLEAEKDLEISLKCLELVVPA